jgi:hypothetical protein
MKPQHLQFYSTNNHPFNMKKLLFNFIHNFHSYILPSFLKVHHPPGGFASVNDHRTKNWTYKPQMVMMVLIRIPTAIILSTKCQGPPVNGGGSGFWEPTGLNGDETVPRTAAAFECQLTRISK